MKKVKSGSDISFSFNVKVTDKTTVDEIIREASDIIKMRLAEYKVEPEESEDERMMRVIGLALTDVPEEMFASLGTTLKDCLSYLEKQKEPHYTKRNALFDECVTKCDSAIMKKVSDEVDEMLEKEQKPISTEDMPYITDEHFYEREPADSFKYKLAEYMTKCCTKKEGPYGYTYAISAEAILKMAEEELLKRGVVQKPAEWSEEDGAKLGALINYFEGDALDYSTDDIVDWLKSLRPQPHNEIYQAAKRDLAIKFMNYLDENRPEGKMSLSNGECEDIDKAFKEGDWAKIIRYIKKYQPHWKPSKEQEEPKYYQHFDPDC